MPYLHLALGRMLQPDQLFSALPNLAHVIPSGVGASEIRMIALGTLHGALTSAGTSLPSHSRQPHTENDHRTKVILLVIFPRAY